MEELHIEVANQIALVEKLKPSIIGELSNDGSLYPSLQKIEINWLTVFGGTASTIRS